mgnify:CR=1 FL=1
MTTPTILRKPLRAPARVLLLLLALAALAVTAAPASAAKPCGRQILDDWYDGRIDGTYALRCYDDAIEIIPRDVRDYSSAEEDITRALQAALRGEPAPPNRDQGGGQGGEDPGPGEAPDDPNVTGTPPGGGGDGDTEVGGTVDGESASSVPVPLLILAGLALLLVAGGSAGYVLRRVQARRITPPAA